MSFCSCDHMPHPEFEKIDQLFERYIESNEYDRFEGCFMHIIRCAYGAGYQAVLEKEDNALFRGLL